MSEFRTSAGRRIFFGVTGDGPPLVLLTGQYIGRRLLTPLVERLSTSYRVVTLDNRDAGESDPEVHLYTLADLANDALALFEHR